MTILSIQWATPNRKILGILAPRIFFIQVILFGNVNRSPWIQYARGITGHVAIFKALLWFSVQKPLEVSGAD